MKPLLTLIFLFILIQTSFSQDIYKYVENYLKKNGTNTISSSELHKLMESANPSDVFYAINRFTSDSSINIRTNAYQLLGSYGYQIKDQNQRLMFTKQLVLGCKDSDSGIVGIVLEYLTQFEVKDFDKESYYELSLLLFGEMPHKQDLIKLVGYVRIPDDILQMKQILSEKKYSGNQERWALHLALARMGEKDEIDYCLNRIKNIPISSTVVYELFPDLVYVRQKLVFDYLLEIIESDKSDCSSPNPDSKSKIICAYKVIQLVAPYIKNFPLPTDRFGDISWSKNSQADLVKVRNWIKTTKESYELIFNKF